MDWTVLHKHQSGFALLARKEAPKRNAFDELLSALFSAEAIELWSMITISVVVVSNLIWLVLPPWLKLLL